MLVQRFFKLRPVNARLQRGGHGLLVDLQNPVHQRHVERNDGAVQRPALRIDTAHDTRAAAIGHERDIVFQAIFQNELHLVDGAGIDNRVGRDFQFARAHIKKIVIALAARVKGAFIIIVTHLVVADDFLQP